MQFRSPSEKSPELVRSESWLERAPDELRGVFFAYFGLLERFKRLRDSVDTAIFHLTWRGREAELSDEEKSLVAILCQEVVSELIVASADLAKSYTEAAERLRAVEAHQAQHQTG